MKALLCAERSAVEGVLSGGIHICNICRRTEKNSKNNGLSKQCGYKCVSAQICAGVGIDSGRDSNQNSTIARRPFSIELGLTRLLRGDFMAALSTFFRSTPPKLLRLYFARADIPLP